MPLISVVLPAFNAQEYIEEAINSILNQTIEDFEILVIDDGSTDDTHKIVEKMAGEDYRIKLLTNEKNMGLIYTLNRGLEEATGEYIARMDADDISLPERFERQIEYLKDNPDVWLCSVIVEFFGAKSEVKNYYYSPEETKAELLYHNGVSHPGYMMRRELIKNEGHRYHPEYLHAEDYEFVVNVARTHEVGIVPKRLLLYRIHENQVSGVNSDITAATAKRVRKEQLQNMGADLTAEEIEDFFDSSYSKNRNISIETLDKRLAMMGKIVTANEVSRYFDMSELKMALARRYAYTVVILSSLKDIKKNHKPQQVASTLKMDIKEYEIIFKATKSENTRGLIKRVFR